MRRLTAFVIVGTAVAVVAAARGGNELPVYPSYYPHEIEIRTLAPEPAAGAVRDGKIQAYLGGDLDLAGGSRDQIRTIESLGLFVVARINPHSTAMQTEPAACAALKTVVHSLAAQSDIVAHPYPVTPFHGDYLYHSDLAAAAKARFLEAGMAIQELRVKASGRVAQNHPQWSAHEPEWDVEVSELDAAELMASTTLAMDGRYSPPWVRHGWFQADRLLADSVDEPARKERVQSDRHRLEAGNFKGLVERINLERDIVTALTGGCRKIVAGYTVKREPINVEYSAGIENVGYDAIAGLGSPMFVRTVKLKDFPWNGWLSLALAGAPAAAWNPVGGMTDPFGRFMGFAIGDPALLPAPYDAGWMLNRISDLPATPQR